MPITETLTDYKEFYRDILKRNIVSFLGTLGISNNDVFVEITDDALPEHKFLPSMIKIRFSGKIILHTEIMYYNYECEGVTDSRRSATLIFNYIDINKLATNTELFNAFCNNLLITMMYKRILKVQCKLKRK